MNEEIHNIDKSAIKIVLLLAAAIVSTHFFNMVISVDIFRLVITIIMVLYAIKKPSISIPLVIFGYFIPVITGADSTVLPQTYSYYIGVMILGIISSYNSSNSRQNIDFFLPRSIIYIYIAFISLLVCSSLFSDISDPTTNQVLTLALGLLAAVMIKTRQDEDIALLSLAIASALLSLWVFLGPSNFNELSLRFEIGFDQNYLSLFISFGMIVLSSFLSNWRAIPSTKYRVFFALLMLLDLLAILRLGSRGAFIAMLIAITIPMLRGSVNIKAILTSIVIGVAFLIVLLQLPGMEVMSGRFTETDDLYTVSYRLPIWIAGLLYFQESSMLNIFFGEGIGASMQILGNAAALGSVSAHNQYIELLVETGLIGLTLFFCLIYLGVKQSLRVSGYPGDARIALIVLFVVGCLSLTPLIYSLAWIVIGLFWVAPAKTLANNASSHYIENSLNGAIRYER